MPVLKASEPLQERPVIILIHGDPGVGKTTLVNTCKNPLLCNFDRGHDRAILRKDTLIVNSWNDINDEEKEGTFKKYSTIGIDTAKAALDDFLMSYVQKDARLMRNKLAAFGAIGEEFKVFLNNRRLEQADIVIIAHSKDEKGDGDIIKKIPDVTGQTHQLLLRVADQVGYMTTVNGKRILMFEPSERHTGKNVARIPTIDVPDEKDPALKDFMATIIERVRKSLVAVSEDQAKAIALMQETTDQINGVKTPDELTALVDAISALPKVQKDPLKARMSAKAKEMKWNYVVADKKFVDPQAKPEEKKREGEKSSDEVLTDQQAEQVSGSGAPVLEF